MRKFFSSESICPEAIRISNYNDVLALVGSEKFFISAGGTGKGNILLPVGCKLVQLVGLILYGRKRQFCTWFIHSFCFFDIFRCLTFIVICCILLFRLTLCFIPLFIVLVRLGSGVIGLRFFPYWSRLSCRKKI